MKENETLKNQVLKELEVAVEKFTKTDPIVIRPKIENAFNIQLPKLSLPW